MKNPLSILFLIFLYSSVSLASFSINVMAPLTIGDLKNPDQSAEEWRSFSQKITQIKQMGADAVSTDIWWGTVEEVEGFYDWRYYDKLVDTIENAGLKWVPILSFHQLGGNVGDDGYVPPPQWIWTKYIGQLGILDQNSLKYKSEQGNYNSEYVSAWGTPYVIQDYRRFMLEFQKHFAAKASSIDEINISLGPAGELRYPSYNSHDRGSGYPTRGALQAYSDLAIRSFQNYVQQKYKNIESLNFSWGFNLQHFQQVYPPNPSLLHSVFFPRFEHFSNYGKDFFDWYNQSLLNHGSQVMNTALEVFDSQSSAFSGIDLGAKIPGVHWRVSTDRLAELSAGLIRTSYANWHSPESGRGYVHVIRLIKDLSHSARSSKVVLHFTALEMDNGREGPAVGSEAKSLVFWMGQAARAQGIIIKGENALAGELHSPRAWFNMRDALVWGGYSGITILRLDPLLSSSASRDGFASLVELRRTMN